jgi:hypothetical protein
MKDELLKQLDSLSSADRVDALNKLLELVESGQIEIPPASADVNMHFHSFFSYNAEDYSPSKIAWLCKTKGLAAAQIVDFDVLDGLEEFYNAAKLLNLKASVGLESRVFVPEFSEQVLNSPGEPGISYHMGTGFPKAELNSNEQKFLDSLKETAQHRNRALIERVNSYLAPVTLDYEKDLCHLTPSGNPTERHICLAYAKKADSIFKNESELKQYWCDKLGDEADDIDLPTGFKLQALIRAKTMKQGGVGYVKPDAGDFPKMAEVNKFVAASGGIPTLTWLDGTSDGEEDIERLLDVSIDSGCAAINLIPDRNFTPGVKDRKLANLQQIIQLAEDRGLPVIVGTEMNSPGLKFVDDFNSEELTPFVPVFLKGAQIVYAHAALQRACGLGYLSDWAKNTFADAAEKNEFFNKLGSVLEPARHQLLEGFNSNAKPKEILKIID